MYGPKSGLGFVAVAAILSLLLGIFIGQRSSSSSSKLPEAAHLRVKRCDSQGGYEVEERSQLQKLVEDRWESEQHLNKDILDLINTTNLRNNLKELSSRPILAGTERDNELARMIQQRFVESGFDSSELVPYDVLLSYPNQSNPNLITIHDGSDKVVFTSRFKEEVLHKDDGDPEFIHSYAAYSPPGDIKTKPGTGLIYVNYATIEDFDKLEELGIDVAGHLVIARFGKIFRGNKVTIAQERNATGIILFSDPNDVAATGTSPADVYPNSFWIPGSGMQRGTTYDGLGDPLTPGWPSTRDAYRLDEKDVVLPKIPCQPIGYDDAREILKKLGGPSPSRRVEGMVLKKSVTTLGPQLLDEFRDHSIRLQSHNSLRITKSYNVIGTIKGEVEPDRYVLYGNHRDAWGYGSIDPSSGTAEMLEVARVFGELKKKGWRPRRTMVFCSWGAEEFGLMGSTEWVEDHVNKLQDRSVAYINTDGCVSGPNLQVAASPLMWDPIKKITKLVPGVSDGETVYDEWAADFALQNKSQPVIGTLSASSDHTGFMFYCGIPSLDRHFGFDTSKYDIDIYPSYHTGYETFYLVDKFLDPNYRILQGCGRMSALLLKYFSDSAVIPYSLSKMAETIEENLVRLKANGVGERLVQIYNKFPVLEEAVTNFTQSINKFVKRIEQTKDTMGPMLLRAVNDQMMKLEQTFILPPGLPGRPLERHAIFAPSLYDAYGTSAFPGISDLLFRINTSKDKVKKEQRKETLRRHISDVTIVLQRAARFLEDFQFI
ncbi:N-acetylated-alpha-linked acidic dipeptidase 2-like isoform X2 [Macrobrachium nipponense]|uniref:N-acetylated-alpha-linked acidic dipeptidase 2-like isoform X2 n=1 Tax=Macrobrachium nipponense TaxID=159736 RepID=UPI0030C8852A